MGSQDVVEGLSFGNEWRKQFADLHQPFRICTDPDSGIPKLLLVGCVGSVSGIVSMILLAGLLLLATGTDVRWLLKFLAARRLVGRTKLPAVVLAAELTAVDAGLDGFCGTKIPLEAAVVR